MKTTSTAAASAAVLAALFGSISAAPTPLEARASTSIEITFNGARNDGATIQAIGMLWPVDGATYTPQQIAAQFPAADYTDVSEAQRVQNAGQSISTGDIVYAGQQISCTFQGADGSTHTIANFPADGDDVTFTIGAPTAFTEGACNLAQ